MGTSKRPIGRPKNIGEKEKTIKIVIKISKELYKNLKCRAIDDEVSTTNIGEKALIEYLKK